jgi:N-terminal acetyltransferase B complex non-catalytic subunit
MLQALKATILLKQPDTAQHERGKQEIVQLCKKEPAITNVEALQQIQDALRDLSLHTLEGPKLWERAIAKDPQNRDVLMTWLHSSTAESNWLSTQKV